MHVINRTHVKKKKHDSRSNFSLQGWSQRKHLFVLFHFDPKIKKQQAAQPVSGPTPHSPQISLSPWWKCCGVAMSQPCAPVLGNSPSGCKFGGLNLGAAPKIQGMIIMFPWQCFWVGQLWQIPPNRSHGSCLASPKAWCPPWKATRRLSEMSLAIKISRENLQQTMCLLIEMVPSTTPARFHKLPLHLQSADCRKRFHSSLPWQHRTMMNYGCVWKKVRG